VSYLLDTNVLSELRKRRPEASVTTWFEAATPSDLYLSVLVVGEIRQGIELLRKRDPTQVEVFERWLGVLRRDFQDRILPVTAVIAEAWGRLNAAVKLPVVDGLLAATALVHGLTFVTRDTAAVGRTGIPVLDPWTVA
jgi:toxin FitB